MSTKFIPIVVSTYWVSTYCVSLFGFLGGLLAAWFAGGEVCWQRGLLAARFAGGEVCWQRGFIDVGL